MREALPPVDLVVVRLRERGCKPKKRGREWDASCPAHDDERPSFGVREGDDGRALVNCQRGCTHEQICDSLALQPADLFPRKPRPNIVETYEYHDANGDVLFQVVRFSPKGFRQRRPDGDGGWKWNLRGVLRVLYGLPHVEATARDGGTIYITEGEKDADAAVLAGVCATTNPGGAGKWKSAYAESLRGASSVVVVADRDEAGRQHARQVAASVSEYVEDVTIVEPLVGNDLSDHLDAGRTIDELAPIECETPDAADRALAEPAQIDGTTIDGADLLDEIYAAVTAYIIWPSEAAAVAYTLWIAATHGQEAWEHATRFVLKSPIKRCGKTRTGEVGCELVHRPLPTTNISPAALTRAIDETDPPTIIIDEADTIFGRAKNAREGSEDLRGILNSGHSRGWPYIRWDVKARCLEECPTFAMAMLAGIGDLPDTIEDRAIVVSMRRRASGESVRPFRRRRIVPGLHELRDRLHAWVTAHVDELEYAEPNLPVEDRAADVWEPIVAVADCAGGDWPDRARRACRELCEVAAEDEGTLGERLLTDLRAIWCDDEEHLPSATILERLHAIEEAPWVDHFGKPLTARGLAKLLKPYGIKSRNIRIGDDTLKGYGRADLADAWHRYATRATPPHCDENPNATSGNGCGGSVAEADVGCATASHQPKQPAGGAVADVAEGRPNGSVPPDHWLFGAEFKARLEAG